MHCPNINIVAYGAFDSTVAFPGRHASSPEVWDRYVMELFPADCAGNTCIDGVTYELKAGTVIFTKPGQTRSSTFPFRCYFIHMDNPNPMMEALLKDIPTCSHPVTISNLIDQLRKIQSINAAHYPENRLLATSGIYRFLYMLINTLEQQSESHKLPPNQKDSLYKVERYIRENLHTNLPVELLAGMCNLSVTHFHRLFLSCFGKTPVQYILECRIYAAKAGLRAPECNLSELAKQCGFSSQSYFCCKFRQATGKTPLEYRKTHMDGHTP